MLKNSQFDFYSIQLFSSKCKKDTTYKTYSCLYSDNEDIINFQEVKMHPSKGPCSNLKHFIYGEGNGDWSCSHHSEITLGL